MGLRTWAVSDRDFEGQIGSCHWQEEMRLHD